jgi:CheY-like chemotaxis protein
VVDANDVVRDISAMIARLIGKRIHLTADLGGTQTPVLADRGQLEQVLLNLAVNARDAMPSGGLLQMSTRAVDISPEEAKRLYPMRTGRYVRLSVRDTGIGMTPEVRARVFEPFFTTKAAGEGTGIGLSTVYRIVKQSGGFIFVESAPQQGATFDVYLPFTTAPAKEGTDAVQDASRACTILLVEDYRRIRELARKILTRQGYRVLTAGSGDEALSLAATYDGTIDLLLTDVMMPGLSGPDLAQRVHRVRPHVPVLYMSGEGSGPLGVADPEGRGGAFLQKPFTPASLAQKVREVLNKTAAERCQ